ncbi:ArnT family glycosyltransferase [Edaphobacter sp.]|uniref:ArnT family glycosyltransferase n=1 Tax=Edaphobacter sp. TaxID=1934404 RepID=UPI002DC01B98|nr:glycosyltransferase family 39 protein [Edaphobacter sp.]HEU5340755.1 glycosyltransferase family 39 protein [Edaphobacter sp.]
MRPLRAFGKKNLSDIPLWTLYPLFFAAVYLSHLTLLRLPYFWDEAGYYIPAAWDFYRTGSLIPQTTLTNAHPPLPSILLASWWHLSGFVPSGTRTLVCIISAAALLGVYRLARSLTTTPAAASVTVLTAVYPIWYAQSTLAHADIFAAAFTLWAFAFYLEPAPESITNNRIRVAALFSFAALSKETAIVTPVALAAWEAAQFIRDRRDPALRREHPGWIIALLVPILPLAAWYAYHFHCTGFVFGNPEFLRYNATANLAPYRIVLCLWHRLLHLTTHMNLYVPVVCGAAALLTPIRADAPTRISRTTLQAITVILVANWVAFSVLGGALLTRYLLPMYPLVLLLCVAAWQRHLRRWWLIAALSAAAFLAGIWINPPYAFAPEDNLTYRDMIVLHVEAVSFIEHHYPQATVLTAWPATAELARPELGYTRRSIETTAIENFSFDQIEKAAADPGAFDTALIFSTKIEPPPSRLDLSRHNRTSDTKYFDFHHDLHPAEVAALLHGEVVWQAHRKLEWAAVLRFPRSVNASLEIPLTGQSTPSAAPLAFPSRNSPGISIP